MSITRDSLLTLEAYAKVRRGGRAGAIAHRRLRSVELGPHLLVQFEDEQTVRRQIQEMLHAEKTFDEAGIQAEIDAYAPLLPGGSDWTATLMLQYPDAAERDAALARLVGVQRRVYVQVAGHARVWPRVDQEVAREHEPVPRTAAVHFLRWPLDDAMVAAVRAGAAVTVGCDHPHYTAQCLLALSTRDSLAADLH